MERQRSASFAANPERRTKPISRQEKELTEALDFLVKNLRMHSEEYHHTTDARKVKRCEAILEEAISELIARKERDAGPGSSTRWRRRRSKSLN
jgi:hypothetical protein